MASSAVYDDDANMEKVVLASSYIVEFEWLSLQLSGPYTSTLELATCVQECIHDALW